MAGETILVTGGTGTVGRALLTELLSESDLEVRALTRNPGASLPAGVTLHQGDFHDLSSLRRAMVGCTKAFLLTSGTDIARHDATAAQAAADVGLRHLVKVSALGVGRKGQDPITRWHRAGEQALDATGIPTTFLRPTGFMSNALNWSSSIVTSGIVAAPYPRGRTALIDPADVARVAAAALITEGHEGQVYELTGPQPLTPAEQVAILADVLHRPLEYRSEDPTTTRRALVRYGMAPDLADAVVDLLASAEEPWNGQPLRTVEAVTGRPPTTFNTWVDQHRTALTTPPRW